MPSPAEIQAAQQTPLDASVERVLRNAAEERTAPTKKPYNQALELELISEGTIILQKYQVTFTPATDGDKALAIKAALISRQAAAKQEAQNTPK